MKCGTLVFVFIIAGLLGSEGVEWDIFDCSGLCEPDAPKGSLCDDGKGCCGGDFVKCPKTGECAYTCLPGKPCYDLPWILNGEVVLSNEDNTLGSTANVICYPGYSADGLNLTCGKDRKWHPKVKDPCQPIVCDPATLPNLTNGYMTILEDTFEGYAVGTCNNNYSPTVDVIVSYCGWDGTWGPINGSCEGLYCDPEELPLGLIPQGDNSIGTTAKLFCNESEELVGCDFVVCTPDLQWTTQIGHCEPACCQPPCIKNGYLVANGMTGVVYCDQGYQLVDPDLNIYCNLSTLTRPDIEYCEEISCSYMLPSVPYSQAHLLQSDLYSGALVLHECDLGYSPVNSEPITSVCTEDGNWETNGTCEKICCDNSSLPMKYNGKFVSAGDGCYGSAFELACDDGYRVDGYGTVYCNLDGTWDVTYAECVLECCPIPCIDNGKIEPHPTNPYVGVLTCEPPFFFNISSNPECNPQTGTWSGVANICVY